MRSIHGIDPASSVRIITIGQTLIFGRTTHSSVKAAAMPRLRTFVIVDVRKRLRPPGITIELEISTGLVTTAGVIR